MGMIWNDGLWLLAGLVFVRARFYGHFRGGSSPCAFSGAQGGPRLLGFGYVAI